MTKKLNKRGFTIVELVVVIVVIAILAAVLIPTVSTLINKANRSADEQAVAQMNKALTIYSTLNGVPTTVGELRTALTESGINADTTPVTSGYAFYWDKSENTIKLVESGDSVEDDWKLLNSNEYGKTVVKATQASDITSALTSAKNSGEPVLIKLQEDVTTTEIMNIEGGTVIIDLNGKNINYNIASEQRGLKISGGDVTLKNGVINVENTNASKLGAIEVASGSTVSVQNMTIKVNGKNATGGCAALFVDGLCDVTLMNCDVSINNGHGIGTNSSKTTSDGSRLTLIDTNVTTTRETAAAINITTYTNVVIDGGTISGGQTGAYFRGCNATIKNATFTHTKTTGDSSWGSGNTGDAADLVFACGGTNFTGYITTSTYVCENVTANNGVIVHEPAGGSVSVSGITLTKEYRQWVKTTD